MRVASRYNRVDYTALFPVVYTLKEYIDIFQHILAIIKYLIGIKFALTYAKIRRD
jgi:hypothetical protein